VPTRLSPTWRNGRLVHDAIARRLDRFLVADSYLSSSVLPSSWVEHPFFSDHAPIFLQLRPSTRFYSTPFKFNYHWLTAADYSAIVHAVWRDPCFLLKKTPSYACLETEDLKRSNSKSWYHATRNWNSPDLILWNPKFLITF
jgi:hypothetical protein